MADDSHKRASDVGRVREPGLRARLAAALLLLVGLASAGCGASTSATIATPTKHSPKVVVPAPVRAEQQAAHQQVLASLHAPVGKGGKPGIPAYIPRNTIAVDRITTATIAHPQLAVQGVPVQLDLPSGRALATLNGPLYNNTYQGSNDPSIPATFVLTFTNTHGTIPIAADDVTILDQYGEHIAPKIRVKGGGPMPTHLDSGQGLTLLMSTIVPAADGAIVYSPNGAIRPGNRPLVGWDFIIEDD